MSDLTPRGLGAPAHGASSWARLAPLGVALAACTGAPPTAPAGPRLAIDVAALSLVGVADVVWDVEVVNGAASPQTVWQRRITSSAYGDGAGSASYVGTCDASAGAAANTVNVWVVGVYDAPVGAAAAGAFNATHDGVSATSIPFQNPTAAAPLTQVVTCREDADVQVRFDVALMRPAQQGFFDIAVTFDDIFCSAKLDCAAGDLLFDASGSRSSTMVLGLACTAGVSATRETILYLDHLDLDCTSPTAPTFDADLRVDPSGPAGNQCTAGADTLSGCAAITEDGFDADQVLYQVGVYRGIEGLTSGGVDAQKVYWNVALGVRGAISGCWLRTRATAADAAGTSAIADGAIAAGAVYPYIQWDVPLGACGSEALTFDDPAAPVRPAYTATNGDGEIFDFGYGETFPAGATLCGAGGCGGPNAPPVAGAPALSAVFGDPAFFSFAEVLAGSTDPNGDTLTVVAVASPVNGVVQLGEGEVQLAPDYGETTATFAFTVDDGRGGQDTGTATVTIDPGSAPSNVASFGRGNTSSLGTGDTSPSAVPVYAIGGHTFAAVDAGSNNACALDAAGQGWCWGIGSTGELGNGYDLRIDYPVPVVGGHTFTTVSTGDYHSCALDTAGQAWCWGRGAYLGAGSAQVDSNVPVPVSQGALVFDFIDAGPRHTCALTPTDEAWCWGENFAQALGIGVAPHQYAPVHAQAGETYVEIRASRIATCARTAAGAIRCWGLNNSGNLGDGSGSGSTTPVDVAGGRTWVALAGVQDTYCAIEDVTERAYCWGSGGFGQIGNGGTSNATTPALVSGGHPFVTISSGQRHSCGVDTDGDGWCWGYGRYGRLGNGDASDTNHPTPQLVLGGLELGHISAGGEFTATLVVGP